MSHVTPTSYSTYAPLRYEVTRPYSKKLAKTAATIMFHHGRNMAKRIFNGELWGLLRKKVQIENHFEFATNESRYLEAYAHFYGAGRVLYDFSSGLTSALLSTDASKIPLDTIKFPSDSFYIHFGDVVWPEGYPANIEGVFVSNIKDDNSNRYIGYQPIKKKQFSFPFYMDVNDEADVSNFNICLDHGVRNLEAYEAEEQADFEGFIHKLNAYCEDESLSEYFGLNGLDARKNAAIAKIVINCLLYINAVPTDVEEIWDDRAPREIVERAVTSEKEGVRASAARTLENQDYLKVRLIGKKFVYATPKDHRESSKKATHIRHGHFRNQAYGRDWAEHRVIFIPPVLINPDADEIPGRIYQA